MAYPFSKIYLIWRLGQGSRRIVVGEISGFKDGAIHFVYNLNGVKEAQRISDNNFKGYPGLDLSQKTFSSDIVQSLFFSRLVSLKRNDAKETLSFWLVEENRLTDKLYILAKTQGLLPTDNFEFVADYYQNQKYSFVTDIAGLSSSHFDLSQLEEGAYLSFMSEPDNEYDEYAVAVFFKNHKIGYIKQGHNKALINRKKGKVTLRVHKIINTPVVRKLYVRIDFIK